MPSANVDMREQIDNWFDYHAPTPEQKLSYEILRRAGRDLAETIVRLCPPSDDRSDAIRKVREAIMTANASIACGGK